MQIRTVQQNLRKENQSEEQDDAAETTVSSTRDGDCKEKSISSIPYKEGDTLLKISRNYYQDAEHVKAIIQLNQIENPDLYLSGNGS